MDEKQCTAYEVICSSFLLALVNDSLDVIPSLLDGLGNSFSDYKNGDKVNIIIEELQVRGGQEQLIMFFIRTYWGGKEFCCQGC